MKHALIASAVALLLTGGATLPALQKHLQDARNLKKAL
jgi:hypothetical protein